MDLQYLDRKSVKLTCKIKTHLHITHQIEVSLANPNFLDQLFKLGQLDDPVYKDMLADLKLLIDPEKVAALEGQEQSISNKEAINTELEQSGSGTLMHRVQKAKADDPTDKPKKKSRRMYRGRPIDD